MDGMHTYVYEDEKSHDAESESTHLFFTELDTYFILFDTIIICHLAFTYFCLELFLLFLGKPGRRKEERRKASNAAVC